MEVAIYLLQEIQVVVVVVVVGRLVQGVGQVDMEL
tara:strand:- start:498 stop:602 length:105 start_codon:yes stop_codon:yes gene_type:complete